MGRPGLNRTSVGLKHIRRAQPLGPTNRPQSNQRGIETWRRRSQARVRARPQSNQRGIETNNDSAAN